MKIEYQFGSETYNYRPNLKELETVLTLILMGEKHKGRSTIEYELGDEMYFDEMCEEHIDLLESWFRSDAEREYEAMLNELDEEEYYPYERRRVWLW